MVMGKTDTFFTEREKDKIEQCIRDVEKTTSGELVVLVTPQSSRYLDVKQEISLFLAAFFAFCASFMFFSSVLWIFIALTIALYIPFRFIVFLMPSAAAPFIMGRRKEYECGKKALQAFYQHGLYNTKDKIGILIMMSVLEKRVHILADKGIYAKLSEKALKEYANKITRGIKKDRPDDAICDVITEMGSVLKKNFPVKKNDTNELPDRVICE